MHARAILITLLMALPAAAQLSLIQRSTGLDAIDWEEGHTELEIGDMNADGHLDIVSVGDHGNPGFNSEEHGILCYLGDGAGNWQHHQYGSFGYGGCGIGDLDRDGNMDVAFGVHHDYGSGLGSKLLGVGRGNGTGAYWTPWDTGMPSQGEDWGMFATDLADFDGDGWLDLISESFGGSNGIRIYRNNGDGTWTYAFGLPGGSVGYTIETGDFNADGYLDFAGTRSTGSIYLGDGDFGFTLSQTGLPSYPYSVDVGDFDGDGRDDLLVDHGSSGVKAWRLSPDTEIWVESSTGLPTFNAEQVQLGDLDGDGDLDAVAYLEPTGRCYINNGDGSWSADASWTMPSPGDGTALRVDGDVDHDGREDIAALATMSGFPFYRNQLRVYSPWQAPAALATRVVKPDGGEVLRQGSVRQLRWVTAVAPVLGEASVDIHLSTTGPAGPWTPIALDQPDNGRYDWRVQGEVSGDCHLKITARAGTQQSTDIGDAAFTILEGGATGLPADWAGGDLVSACPNPAGGRTRLSWTRRSAQPTQLKIFDVQGRLVLSREAAGRTGSLDWSPAREVSSGIYFIEMGGGAERISGKLLLLR